MNCRDIAEFSPIYLSAELEEDRRIEFAAHLAECRSCASLMEQQAAMDRRLRDALSEELPDTGALQRSVRGRIAAEGSRRWWIVAAAAAFLFAAILGYRVLRPTPTPRLYADAARDHHAEVVERQPRRWRSDAGEIGKLAGRYDLSSVDALAPPGFRLEHAKMCGIDGKAALHLVYTDGVQEISVYIRRRDKLDLPGDGYEIAHGKILYAAKVGAEHLAAFQSERLEAVIASGGSGDECLQFARFAAGVL